MRDLSYAVRSRVRPELGRPSSKVLGGRAATGDATFSIDEIAEECIEKQLVSHPYVAYYTEDRGLVSREGAGWVLVIDPIDGTRPAAAGLESCCVSIAAAPVQAGCSSMPVEESMLRLRMKDVAVAMVLEIKNDASFIAVRNGGARIEIEGKSLEPKLSTKTGLTDMFWTAGYRGRPAVPLTTVLSRLIDLSSVDGGYFDLGSATFNITRVLAGQMDAYIDVGQRMAEESEEVRDRFLEVGKGAILNNYPYDLAAAALIASESGAIVSDAYGRPLDGYPLIPAKGKGQLSSVVTSNRSLHSRIMRELDAGMKRLVGER